MQLSGSEYHAAIIGSCARDDSYMRVKHGKHLQHVEETGRVSSTELAKDHRSYMERQSN